MTYWTVLVLTIFVDGQQMQSRLLFPSMKACGDASAVIYHDTLRRTLRTAWRNVKRAPYLARVLA
jgi:hypothetical protein